MSKSDPAPAKVLGFSDTKPQTEVFLLSKKGQQQELHLCHSPVSHCWVCDLNSPAAIAGDWRLPSLQAQGVIDGTLCTQILCRSALVPDGNAQQVPRVSWDRVGRSGFVLIYLPSGFSGILDDCCLWTCLHVSEHYFSPLLWFSLFPLSQYFSIICSDG